MAQNIPRGMKGLAALDMSSFTDANGHPTTIDKVQSIAVSDPAVAEVVDLDLAAGTCAVKRLEATSDQVSNLVFTCDGRKQPAGQPDEVATFDVVVPFTTLDEDAVAGSAAFTSIVPA